MNNTLNYFVETFGLDLSNPSPITLRYSRYNIINAFRELNFSMGVEVGTEHGRYAEKVVSSNPQLKLYCVDPYLAIPYYEAYKEQEEVDSFYEVAKNRLSEYNCVILKTTSMEAVKQFEDNGLDFVFIDADHRFEFVINDLIYWSRKVKPGGIVYGHDYIDDFQVKQAVHVYTDVYKINPWFILHKGGRLIDSWMFVRQETDQIFLPKDSYWYQ